MRLPGVGAAPNINIQYRVYSVSLTCECRLIKEVVEGPPRKLIEAVAEDIADRILEKHALIQGVRLHICKPHVAIEGVVDSLGAFCSANCLIQVPHKHCLLVFLSTA